MFLSILQPSSNLLSFCFTLKYRLATNENRRDNLNSSLKVILCVHDLRSNKFLMKSAHFLGSNAFNEAYHAPQHSLENYVLSFISSYESAYDL